MTQQVHGRGPILVIGYGNTLRGDDGVGPHVAGEVAAWHDPRIRTLVCHQLTPELAEDVARATRVIFVDAARGRQELGIEKIQAGTQSGRTAHQATPAALLVLARSAYGAAPEAWAIAIPAGDFEAGAGISRTCGCHVEPALQAIRNLVG